MIQKPRHFVITDPREYDGNPYEVAARAFAQAEATAEIFALTLDFASLMARNAEMEREMALGGEPNAAGFADSAQGKRLAALREAAKKAARELQLLGRVAGYDPLHPPKEG